MLFTINLVWDFGGASWWLLGCIKLLNNTFLYIKFGACFPCWDSHYCAMSVSLHVHVNCVYDVMWAWLSVSAISVIITFAVLWDYFSQGMSRLIHHQLSFSIYHLTHFYSSYMCESTSWDSTHTDSKGVSECYLAVAYIIAIICIYYYTAAYNTPETQNYDCVSYDIRRNPK